MRAFVKFVVMWSLILRGRWRASGNLGQLSFANLVGLKLDPARQSISMASHMQASRGCFGDPGTSNTGRSGHALQFLEVLFTYQRKCMSNENESIGWCCIAGLELLPIMSLFAGNSCNKGCSINTVFASLTPRVPIVTSGLPLRLLQRVMQSRHCDILDYNTTFAWQVA